MWMRKFIFMIIEMNYADVQAEALLRRGRLVAAATDLSRTHKDVRPAGQRIELNCEIKEGKRKKGEAS